MVFCTSDILMPWQIQEREFTTWCELEQDETVVWLEWNERVFAYRCGVVRDGVAGRSHLGFADSLPQAQKIALALLE
jgi:hypothetical protein